MLRGSFKKAMWKSSRQVGVFLPMLFRAKGLGHAMKILHMTDPEAASNTTTPLSWKADPQVFLANGASHIAEFIELI
jgi:hypothetical protein